MVGQQAVRSYPANVNRFTRFVAVDWSGAVGPRQRGIALASCPVGDDPPVLERAGHVWSREEALAWTLQATAAEAMLIGFDLSPAFPFADQSDYFPGWYASPHDARALWSLVEEITAGDPYLSANSFVDHPQACRHFRRHGGRAGDRFGTGRGRLRVVEQVSLDQRIASPYSCFNLVGAAQVGKSSLTGMRLFHRLDGHVPIWPFDPLPTSGPVVVEIYTSLAAVAARVRKGRAKIRDAATLDTALAHLGSRPHAPLAYYEDHATDAILAAAWLRAVAHDPSYWNPTALTPELARTEGWTFGVR